MTDLVCPTCRRRFDSAKTDAMPFCCERCRLIDLGHWLDERYGLPANLEDDGDEIMRGEAEQ